MSFLIEQRDDWAREIVDNLKECHTDSEIEKIVKLFATDIEREVRAEIGKQLFKSTNRIVNELWRENDE